MQPRYIGDGGIRLGLRVFRFHFVQRLDTQDRPRDEAAARRASRRLADVLDPSVSPRLISPSDDKTAAVNHALRSTTSASSTRATGSSTRQRSLTCQNVGRNADDHVFRISRCSFILNAPEDCHDQSETTSTAADDSLNRHTKCAFRYSRASKTHLRKPRSAVVLTNGSRESLCDDRGCERRCTQRQEPAHAVSQRRHLPRNRHNTVAGFDPMVMHDTRRAGRSERRAAATPPAGLAAPRRRRRRKSPRPHRPHRRHQG